MTAAKDLQLLFELVLKSDKDENERIGDEELERFILRARAIYGKNHRIFNEENIKSAFTKTMSTRKTTAGLLDVVESFHEDHLEAQAKEEEALRKSQQQQQTYPQEMTLQKIPSRTYAPDPSTSSRDVRRAPTTEGAQTVVRTNVGIAVRSTGLVVPNSTSMETEGKIVPNIGVKTDKDRQRPSSALDSSIKDGNSVGGDKLLNDLLSSNSNDFDYASLQAVKHGRFQSIEARRNERYAGLR